jgi:type IV pilus assembly protein PilA
MVSIPMYSSYLNRAKASEGLTLVAPIKMAVSNFLMEHGSLDLLRSNLDLGLKEEIHGTYVENIKVMNLGIIDVIYKEGLGNLIFIPKVNGSQIDWDCTGGSLDQSYRPKMCQSK